MSHEPNLEGGLKAQLIVSFNHANEVNEMNQINQIDETDEINQLESIGGFFRDKYAQEKGCYLSYCNY